MSSIHFINKYRQRPNESIAYTFDTTALGGSPTGVTQDCKAIGSTSSTDASAKITGSVSVSGDNITTGLLGSLTDGTPYHLIITFTIGGNTLQYYWIVECTDDRPPDA